MKSACDRSRVARSLAFALLLAPPFLCSQSQTGATPNADTAAIASLEDRWLQAIQTADIPTLDSILADDFLRPAAGRFITKAQLLDYYNSHHPAPAPAKHIERLQVSLYGTVAIARGFVVSANVQSQTTSKSLFTDVFVKRAGKWQAISAQEN